MGVSKLAYPQSVSGTFVEVPVKIGLTVAASYFLCHKVLRLDLPHAIIACGIGAYALDKVAASWIEGDRRELLSVELRTARQEKTTEASQKKSEIDGLKRQVQNLEEEKRIIATKRQEDGERSEKALEDLRNLLRVVEEEKNHVLVDFKCSVAALDAAKQGSTLLEADLRQARADLQALRVSTEGQRLETLEKTNRDLVDQVRRLKDTVSNLEDKRQTAVREKELAVMAQKEAERTSEVNARQATDYLLKISKLQDELQNLKSPTATTHRGTQSEPSTPIKPKTTTHHRTGSGDGGTTLT